MQFSAINIQGNIISGEILEKIRIEDIRYQSAKDFPLSKNTTLRDEIGIAWAAARAHWQAFSLRRDRLDPKDSGTSETRQSWMIPFLRELGYELDKASAEIINGKTYAISHRSVNRDDFPVHIIGINQNLDRRPETGGTRISPHALIQEYLNNHDHLFAMVTNGKFLRLLRDATRLSRISYLEFDLERIMEEELFAEFAVLYRTLHISRMPVTRHDGEQSPIEYYHQEALNSGSRIREKLSEAIEKSIKMLANGLLKHPDNGFLRDSIADGTLSPDKYYLYLLRMVYRTLFLLVIEERKLIYPEKRDPETDRKRDIYYRYYSLNRLTHLAEKQVYIDPRKNDLWQALIVTYRIFEDGTFSSKLNIKPLGSGLFAPDAMGIIPNLKLDNEYLLRFLQWLVTFENENQQRVRVNYADLDVEEFGSVYEGLLDYKATFVDINGEPEFTFVKGSERSSSGSHYTPEELVKPLIKHSLEYLIEDCITKPEERLKLNPPFMDKKEVMQEQALLSLKVADVACGSGHILLSAARRLAIEVARVRTGEEQPSPMAMRVAMRDVIKSCIYGVDKNPLAVELCKVALWLEAHNPGEPLGFLDHHIKCGDSIVGLAHREELENGIATEAFKTLPSDDKTIAQAYAKKNRDERKEREDKQKAQQLKASFENTITNEVNEAMAEYRTFSKLPETSPEQIAAKARAYKKFLDGKGYSFLKAMADTQVAQFFVPKTTENKDRLITDAEYRQILRGYGGWTGQKTALATKIANENGFFHWFLEFPEVFQEGGFDCILGNPPYLGGKKITTNFGVVYLDFLKSHYLNGGGVADLASYFLQRDILIIKKLGFISLITTNTISQGDTKLVGLGYLESIGGSIVSAERSVLWPGQAAVTVTLISITKIQWTKSYWLDKKKVDSINSHLTEGYIEVSPYKILSNDSKSFIGSYILGDGFILGKKEVDEILQDEPLSSEIIFNYLNGYDLNGDIYQRPSRYVINFFDKPEVLCKTKYSRCFEVIEQRVKPERTRLDEHGKFVLRTPLPIRWWQFADKRPLLYKCISKLSRVLVATRVSKNLIFSFVPNGYVYSDALVVFSFDDNLHFSLINSSLHEYWAWKFSSTMRSAGIRYTPTTAFETFPFPQNPDSKIQQGIEHIGETYHEYRRQLMLKMILGLTKTYNAFHAKEIHFGIVSRDFADKTPKEIEKQYGKEVWNLWNHLQKTPNTCSIEEVIAGILKLRELHVEMDNAVLEAYGWQDIQLKHDFYEVDYLPENDRVRFTIHPEARKEVLKRLLELNHKIHQEEVEAGLWDKKGSKEYKKAKEEISEVNEPQDKHGQKKLF